MKIGITYDIKEQYGFTSLDLNFTDFLNVADVSFAKEELEKCGHEVFLLGNAQQMIHNLYKIYLLIWYSIWLGGIADETEKGLFLPFWRAMGLHIPEQILMAAHFAWIKYKPNSLQTF